MSEHRLINALLRRPVDKTPVWIMRQAGRYLPEYRELRKKAGSFMQLCQTPELACEVTLQPLKRFPLDAAIIFSDILTIPDAMGLGLHFVEKEGPRFSHPVRNAKAIAKLPIPDPETELAYVCDAIRLTRKALDNKTPLIGFAGSPWTLATYMVEGATTKSFSKVKGMLFSDSALMHQLLEKLTQATILYLNAQIGAGAQAIMLFDTWGGVLSHRDYNEFSLRYMQRVLAELNTKQGDDIIPTILFSKNTSGYLEDIAKAGSDAVGLDWTVDMADASRRIGNQVALQGNMDPAILYADEARIRKEVKTILDKAQAAEGHVFNLGHGIFPDVPPEHVAFLVDAVHAY